MSDNQWLQDDEGRWRRATKHHMGRRLATWDYRRQGSYVITIVLADRRSNALGELFVKAPGTEDKWLTIEEAKALKLPPEAVEAKIVFSELGKAIFTHFQRMGEFTPGLKPVYCAIMPDHIHLLIKVEAELERPIGNAIGGFKTGCEKIFAEMGCEGRLFAPGFVDEIILRAGQIASEFNYLRDNPRRLAVKRLYPDLFKYSRRLAVNLRLAQQGLARQRASQGLAGQGAVMVSPAPMAQAIGWFSAIGNHFLLDRPLAQVQVSRHYFRYKRELKPGGGLKIVRDANGEPLVELASREYEARRDELMAAAKRGAVLLSPCISDGER